MVTNPTKTWNAETVRHPATKHLQAGPRVNTGRDSKRIGVEVEFFGVNKHIAHRALVRAGLKMRTGIDYNHEVIPGEWKLVTDASVNGRGTNAYSGASIEVGLELVSPPLTSAQMEIQLSAALAALKEVGATIDGSCGVHVHHEIDDLSVDAVKNVFKIYAKHEPTINSILPYARHDNDYCGRIDDYRLEIITEGCESISDIADWYDDNYERRYSAINMMSYIKYGTMEFRQYNGTLEFDEIMNWVMITQAMVAAGKAKKAIRKGKSDVVSFERELNMIGTEQSAFVVAHKKALKRA